MHPECPKCPARRLRPVDGAREVAGVMTFSCAGCGGFWVPQPALDGLRASGLLERLDAAPAERPEQDRRTGACPEGHGLLRRARISWEDPFFLERCPSCLGVWFDAGEWSRMAEAGLFDRLGDLWGAAWREQLSEEQVQRALRADLEVKLGPVLFERVEGLASDLLEHEHRAVALAYLRRRLREKRVLRRGEE